MNAERGEGEPSPYIAQLDHDVGAGLVPALSGRDSIPECEGAHEGRPYASWFGGNAFRHRGLAQTGEPRSLLLCVGFSFAGWSIRPVFHGLRLFGAYLKGMSTSA